MNTVWIALVIAGIMGLGIYFAVTDLTQQYALDTSGSLASGATCAADKASVRPNQAVTVRLSGVPTGTVAAWSTPEGSGRAMADGTFAVTFPSAGSKAVSAFLQEEGRWYRVSCTVLVQ